MRTRIWCVSVALCLLVSLTPSRLLAQPTPEEVLARWKEDLQRQDERLRRQEWRESAQKARDLVAEMVHGLLTGEGAAQMLALAVAQQAVAESGLGNTAEAVWLWHLAQNLDPRYRDLNLKAYGPAGEELGRFRLRQRGKAPAGSPALPAEGSYEPPQVIRQEEARTPRGLESARVVADVEVEVVVGPDGRISEPVLVTEPEYPSLALVVLESLRGWRLAPARAGDVAITALFRTRVSLPGLRAAAERAPDDQRSREAMSAESAVLRQRVADLDARLRRSEWQEVRDRAQELVVRLREVGPEHGPLAEGLRALALAEAGMGRTEEAIWHWQVARNLRPGLELDPAAYGDAGRLLEQHKLRSRDEAPPDMEVVTVAGLGAGSTPPRKIAGDEPVATGFLAAPQIPTWTRLQAVIDAEGQVVAPVLLAGRLDAVRWAALEAVRTWRFEPARRGGQPVAVFLDITLPTRTPRPLAEVVPRTDDLGRVHALLLERQWERAHEKASDLAWNAGERGDDPAQTAGALAFLAVAKAGSGDPTAVCYWHAAQSLSSALYHADLAAYGAAGALLEASNPWVQPIEEIFFVDSSPTAARIVTRPEKIAGRPPVYTLEARKAGLQGVVITETLIGEDGRVYQPRVLKGLPMGLSLSALTTLCEWRFKPAMFNGKPVKVHYTLTINYSISAPRP